MRRPTHGYKLCGHGGSRRDTRADRKREAHKPRNRKNGMRNNDKQQKEIIYKQ